MSYVVLAAREGKVVKLDRGSVVGAFLAAAKLRELGYSVKVRRPGTTTLETEVVRAVTS